MKVQPRNPTTTPMFTWHPMTTPPERTGFYLLGHAGYITAQNHFFARDKAWSAHVNLGWQHLPEATAHRPTHWMCVPYPPMPEEARVLRTIVEDTNV